MNRIEVVKLHDNTTKISKNRRLIKSIQSRSDNALQQKKKQFQARFLLKGKEKFQESNNKKKKRKQRTTHQEAQDFCVVLTSPSVQRLQQIREE